MEFSLLGGVFGLLSDLPIWFRQATIYTLIDQWEYAGVFDLLLPFLLIFSIVFGILSATNILGGSKGTSLIISLVIALMALRFGFVSYFFAELFPRFAIGLVVLVIVVIMAGLFITPESMRGWFIGFAIAGIIIGIIVVIQTFDTFYWYDSFFWRDSWGLIVGGIILIILIVFVAVSSGPKSDSYNTQAGIVPFGPLRQAFGR